MDARDLIGNRGEHIACTRLLDFCGNTKAYFNPFPLGHKCPLFDLLVELEGVGDRAAYFLAQVKATRIATGRRATRLPAASDRPMSRRWPGHHSRPT